MPYMQHACLDRYSGKMLAVFTIETLFYPCYTLTIASLTVLLDA